MSASHDAADRTGVAFKTLGCKVNRVESDQIAAELIGRGAVIVSEADASVVVVNTCTVTGEADAKARKAVRHALRLGSQPVVVVTGCLAAIDAESLEALDERVVADADKSRVAERVARALDLRDTSGRGVRETLAVGTGFRTRSTIKIEDGCDNFCTYCIVPYARGVPRATPLVDIVSNVSALVQAGVREVVLTGINIGRYDDEGAGLDAVVRAVAGTGIARVRLSSVEPVDLTPSLLDAIGQSPCVCEHLHVPLQSGDDAVLERMGRAYTSAEYAQLVERARGSIEGLTVTTDVIAGFPGESDDSHRATLRFVEDVGFSKLHVFRYSERAGTPAASMVQVPASVRSSRALELRELGARLRSRYLEARMGDSAQVLVESVVDRFASGTTRDYIKVTLPSDAGVNVGDLVETVLAADACS